MLIHNLNSKKKWQHWPTIQRKIELRLMTYRWKRWFSSTKVKIKMERNQKHCVSISPPKSCPAKTAFSLSITVTRIRRNRRPSKLKPEFLYGTSKMSPRTISLAPWSTWPSSCCTITLPIQLVTIHILKVRLMVSTMPNNSLKLLKHLANFHHRPTSMRSWCSTLRRESRPNLLNSQISLPDSEFLLKMPMAILLTSLQLILAQFHTLTWSLLLSQSHVSWNNSSTWLPNNISPQESNSLPTSIFLTMSPNLHSNLLVKLMFSQVPPSKELNLNLIQRTHGSSISSPSESSQSRITMILFTPMYRMVTSTPSVTIMTSMMVKSSTLQTVTHLNPSNGSSADPILPPLLRQQWPLSVLSLDLMPSDTSSK